jgi:hypothetical protein
MLTHSSRASRGMRLLTHDALCRRNLACIKTIFAIAYHTTQNTALSCHYHNGKTIPTQTLCRPAHGAALPPEKPCVACTLTLFSKTAMSKV